MTDPKIYNDEIRENYYEKTTQLIDQIFSRTNGTINLKNMTNKGDYSKMSYFKNLDAGHFDRTPYVNDASTATPIVQGEMIGVKIGGGFHYSLAKAQYDWADLSQASAGIQAMGTGIAEGIIKNQFNKAVGCLVGAIENTATLTNDVSGSSNITNTALLDAEALRGDRGTELSAMVMHTQTFYRLVKEAYTNATGIFDSALRVGNLMFSELWNKPVVVTDSPALYEAGTPNKYKVLTLAPNAMNIEDNGDFEMVFSDSPNGITNINYEWLINYSFNAKMLGFNWDVANGQSAPNEATLFTGTNWDQELDDKMCAGVLTVGDASL